MVRSDRQDRSQYQNATDMPLQPSREGLLLALLTQLSSMDLLHPEAQDTLADGLCRVFDSQTAGICTLQGDRSGLARFQLNGKVLAFQIDDPDLNWDEARREGGLFGPTAWSANSARARGIPALPRQLNSGLTSAACAPLMDGGWHGGALVVGKRAGPPLDEADLELLSALAASLASQLHNQARIQSLQAANAGLETSRDQLLYSRNVLRALFDSFPDGLYIVDQEYRLTAVNMQRSRRTGKHPNALVGRNCYQALYGRESPCRECRVWSTLFYGETTMRTHREKNSLGDILEWELSSYPIFDNQEQVVQAILLEQDITEKRRLELTLAQSEKLAAVGQWAATLAHEINNPLTAIIANAQLLQREIPKDDDRYELVDLISRAGERANQVVRNLLDLARRDEYLFGPTDINQTIHTSLSFLQHEFVARSTSLVFEPAESLPLLQASPDHLQGVWLNLLTNALDSVENERGEIRVKTYAEGDEVFVMIADNGEGIPPEELERIFEPFYTTKEPGRGTGLGLSVCQRIIKQHGGRILVSSQPGAGTQFVVVLPAS